MNHTVIFGKHANSPEFLACEDLRHDLEEVVGKPVALQSEEAGIPESGAVYLAGTPQCNDAIAALGASGQIGVTALSPGPQGGQIVRIDRPGKGPLVVLAGSDFRGAQRAVYEFSHVCLGVDPFKYFTSYAPKRQPDFHPPALNRMLPPPAAPILCYFDNDDDELVNMTKPYLEFDLDTWKGVIDSLVRIGYNAIDIHDQLGRSEFYRWDEYKKIRPDYHCNLELVSQLIDYAHSKGVMIQIPMYLAWEFRHITEEQANCWTHHKQAWIDTWTYYMKETPLGKGDLFLDRPRSQLWDSYYKSSIGEDVGVVMTEAFTALRDVVKSHNPDAILICDLYAHGQKLWHEGTFQPPKDFIMAWPNDGWGNYQDFPNDKRGYDFGCYMHAGFWLNHVVQDPYPERIEKSMRELLVEHGANHYVLVNGQTFRHFLLNLEAYSRAVADPAHFDGDEFYREFTTRYFGPKASPQAIAAFRQLHEVSEKGYVQLIHDLMADLKACKERRVVESLAELRAAQKASGERLAKLKKALEAAQEAVDLAGEHADFCHDHLLLPIRLFSQTVALCHTLQEALVAWNEYKLEGVADGPARANAAIAQAKELFAAHLQTREDGDKDPKWKTWYDLSKRRPNGGFPVQEDIEQIRFGISDGNRSR